MVLVATRGSAAFFPTVAVVLVYLVVCILNTPSFLCRQPPVVSGLRVVSTRRLCGRDFNEVVDVTEWPAGLKRMTFG